jgi:hypothetical protein
MAMPTYSMRQLLEAGVHFGHHTRRWNPKMSPYLFGVRNGIHVIDLEQTVPMLHQGLQAIRDVVASGGRVLLVGTKRQAQEPVAEAAKRCGQYYVNYRWLGGMLTNFKTISQSIKRLRELEERITQEQIGLTKRELLELTRFHGCFHVLQALDRNLQRLEVGQHAAEPAGVDVGHTGALRLFGDRVARLTLRADEQDRAAIRCQLTRILQRVVVHRQRLFEVDDVNLVAMAENEGGHLRVPEARLVTEVDTCFQHLTHGNCHENLR